MERAPHGASALLQAPEVLGEMIVNLRNILVAENLLQLVDLDQAKAAGLKVPDKEAPYGFLIRSERNQPTAGSMCPVWEDLLLLSGSFERCQSDPPSPFSHATPP
jgi:hypothetical protein